MEVRNSKGDRLFFNKNDRRNEKITFTEARGRSRLKQDITLKFREMMHKKAIISRVLVSHPRALANANADIFLVM